MIPLLGTATPTLFFKGKSYDEMTDFEKEILQNYSPVTLERLQQIGAFTYEEFMWALQQAMSLVERKYKHINDNPAYLTEAIIYNDRLYLLVLLPRDYHWSLTFYNYGSEPPYVEKRQHDINISRYHDFTICAILNDMMPWCKWHY